MTGWPYNEGMCGDGPVQEHPWGSICQIARVHDPERDHFKYYPVLEIDLEELTERLNRFTCEDGAVNEHQHRLVDHISPTHRGNEVVADSSHAQPTDFAALRKLLLEVDHGDEEEANPEKPDCGDDNR